MQELMRRHAPTTFKADGRTIRGTASVFYNPADPGTEYRMSPKMVERIGRKAFTRSLNERPDLFLFWNHDEGQVLARRGVNMQVRITDAGLEYEAELPNTTAANDALEYVRSGMAQGSSFGFVPTKISTRKDSGLTINTVDECLLLELSVVFQPAYPGTTAEVRCFTEHDLEHYEERAAKIRAKLTN